MKNRQEQRKKKNGYRKPWLNSEGYRDPTAYLAMRNAARSEKPKA